MMVEHVSATRIFARPLADGGQYLAYSMNFAAAADLAMILPLPVPPSPGEDAVRFVSLQGYDRFFDDVGRAFPRMLQPQRKGGPLAGMQASHVLKVHDVGDFEASFVPTVGDFDRLDERFRLSPDVWEKLPAYRDWGFAVFKLQTKPRGWWARVFGGASPTQTVHPMAFLFPRRDARSIYFPTVHVHDGEVHESAQFDHTLYCQPDEVVAATFDWERSDGPIEKWVDVERARGLVDRDAPVFRHLLMGPYPNADVDLTPPECADVSALTFVGEVFELRIRGTKAYVGDHATGRTARWRDTARSRLDHVRAHLHEGIEALLAASSAGWGVRPYDAELEEFWVNGKRLSPMAWRIGHGGLDAPEQGPIRVCFELFDERIEPQHVVLAFDDVPDAARVGQVKAALDEVLASAPLGD